MKDYNEMANAVFRRRDEFVAARKKRNGILLRAGVSVSALLLVAVVGISVWRSLPEIPVVTPTEPSSATLQTEEATLPAQTITQQEVSSQIQKETQETVDTPQQGSTAKPAVTPDKPQTETTLPPDPTEPKNDIPATDGSSDSATDGSADSTTAPAADAPGKDPFPGWTPDTLPQEPETVEPTAATESPMVTMAPSTLPPEPTTCQPTLPEATTTPCVETTTGGDLTLPDETQPAPTEPVAGSFFLECEAQVGDMVNLTVELQADELINTADIIAKYGYDNLEVVNLWDLGFTKDQFREAHAPNLGDAICFVNYNAGEYGKYGAVKLGLSATEKEFAVDFTENKVLMTFSFIVKKSGITTFEVVPNEMKSVSGTCYYRNGNQVTFDGINLGGYLTVIPASEVVLPAPPAEEETKPSEETPFTYPEESTDGDLIINCDSRTYSANIGDTVTFVTELKAEDLFENIHIELDYPDDYLSLNVPEKGKQAFPNMYGMVYNFEGRNSLVIMTAVDVYGFDFTSRQVLAQLEFEVVKAGEIDLDLHFQDMSKCRSEGFVDEAYFDDGVQKSFDDIFIYEYVIVNKPSDLQK